MKSECRDRLAERVAMRSPTVLADRSVARGVSQRSSHTWIGKSLEGLGEGLRCGRVVEEAFVPVLDERGEAIDAWRHHWEAARHVLEDLERRPVEAERQGTVCGDVERRDA